MLALVPIITPAQVLYKLPVMPGACLFRGNVSPTLTMRAHAPEMHIAIAIEGSIGVPCRHPVLVERQVPPTITFASRALFGASEGRFPLLPIHESIRM